MTGAWRQEWAQAVRGASDLSMTARMVGQVLALDFANRETGQCNPSRQTLADHLGVSKVTINRAIAELTEGGWLTRTGTSARNRNISYTLLSPGKVVAFAPVSAAEGGRKQPEPRGESRGESAPIGDHIRSPISEGTVIRFDSNGDQICTPPYKGRNQVKNQGRAREPAADGGRRPRPAPHCYARVELHSEDHAAWDRWLAENGQPCLAELPALHRSGAFWPLRRSPPSDPTSTEGMMALRVVEWAIAMAEDAPVRCADGQGRGRERGAG